MRLFAPAKHASTADAFRVLRSTVNQQLDDRGEERPLVVTVVAADVNDGRTLVARGLAEAYAAAGIRTALVDLAAAPSVDARPQQAAEPTIVSVHDAALLGAAALRARFDELRSSYTRVVVAASDPASSDAALHFVTRADGVLVAVRLGRRSGDADHALRDRLEQCGARLLGAVPLGRAATRRQRVAAAAPAGLAQAAVSRAIS